MNELALFAGAGGGILAGQLLGWRTICAVEIEPYPASVLLARQNDGLLPPFPIWDDVCTFDGRPWCGIVDVVSGGFPCQDISVAGKGAGLDGERSGLWAEFARIIREVQPKFVFVENSPTLTSRGLGRVLGDLAEMGFNAQWGVLGANEVGAPHIRKRIWIVANRNDSKAECRKYNREDEQEEIIITQSTINVANSGCAFMQWGGFRRETQKETRTCSKLGRPSKYAINVANTDSKRLEKLYVTPKPDQTRQYSWSIAEIGDKKWWSTEPNVGRVAHGVAARVDRLKALGNGQVPQCAAKAWEILSKIRVKEK